MSEIHKIGFDELTARQKSLLRYAFFLNDGEESRFSKEELGEEYATSEVLEDIKTLLNLHIRYEKKLSNNRLHSSGENLFLNIKYTKGLFEFKWNKDLVGEVSSWLEKTINSN